MISPSSSPLVLVYTTHKNEKEAQFLAEKLLRKKLIVCANVFHQGSSVYLWQGDLKIDREVVAILKTTSALLKDLEVEVHKEHPYDIPCFVVLQTQHVSSQYLEWAKAQIL